MAKQKGNSEPILAGFSAVDVTLKRIAEIDRQIDLIESNKNAEIDKSKTNAIELSTPLAGEKKELTRNLRDYCEFNKEQFAKQRSKELNWGTVGYRMTPPALKALSKWTWPKVLAKLKETGRTDFIAVKESIDKEAIGKAKLRPEDLSIYGMKMESKDEFWFETKRDSLKDTEEETAKQKTANAPK